MRHLVKLCSPIQMLHIFAIPRHQLTSLLHRISRGESLRHVSRGRCLGPGEKEGRKVDPSLAVDLTVIIHPREINSYLFSPVLDQVWRRACAKIGGYISTVYIHSSESRRICYGRSLASGLAMIVKFLNLTCMVLYISRHVYPHNIDYQ
jgi:hypothetical protein